METGALEAWGAISEGLRATEIRDLFALHEYQGYNPKTFFNWFYNQYVTKGGVKKDVFIADMKEILAFYAVRGTKMDKGQLKSKEESKKRLKDLRDRYDIKDNVQQVSTMRTTQAKTTATGSAVGGVALPPEVVTVARIAGCFPALVCKLDILLRKLACSRGWRGLAHLLSFQRMMPRHSTPGCLGLKSSIK